MAAPSPGIEAGEQPAADTLLDAFKTIDASDRLKHEVVLNYWLSVRSNRELPPLRDLDPLEISDAAPSSVLLELLGGGEDAEIRHLGDELKSAGEFDKISEAPRPSILASIARKLSIVAISRNFLAFEEDLAVDGEQVRCWVTMMPFSSAGAWVDYVYAYVSFGAPTPPASKTVPAPEPAVDAPVEEAEVAETQAEPVAEAPVEAVAEDDTGGSEEDVLELDSPVDDEPSVEPAPAEPGGKTPGFSFDVGAASGFYATKGVKVKPTLPAAVPAPASTPAPATPEPAKAAKIDAAPSDEPEVLEEAVETPQAAAEEKPHPVTSALEGSLQSKLTEVRTKADEARMAKLRANAALYEGLSAAYDFALDAEDSPEEYLKLVEAQGLKIQLRSPMRPVVKLAFDGMCDDSTIAQLEAVLAWAIEQDLPRGSLSEKIEQAGGIGPILAAQAQSQAKAA